MKKSTFYLITLLALIMSSVGAMAQNSGTTPYAGSTHVYSVTKSPMSGTTLSWAVSGGGAIQGATNGTSATVLWGSTAGTYTVSVTETTTSTCSTQKTFSVTVVTNPYNLIVAGPSGPICATGSGTIIPNNATFPGYTQIAFTVTASGNAKDSKYDYQLTSSTGANITNVAIDHPVYSGVNLTGTDLTLSGGTSLITFTVTVKSRFDIQDLVTLTISNGKDFYGTSENLTSDNTAIATINAVPNTTAISAD